MVTSRIVQATAAVQQFVQRCLLNLENGNSDASLNVSPSAIDGTDWENWRKNYRVWQAAVQVFLYPENWIDPTLRDDRTPIFKDLQNQLLQGSVTSDKVEAACLSYLEDLRQVARLEIMGIYNQTDTTTGANITHVFGRTYSSPRVYFYRSLDNNLNVWSPWQKLDVGIAGDQLIPVVWNNRLYVFWPNYKETTDPTNNNFGASATTVNGTTTVGTPSPTLKTLEVTMSWSEYRHGAWTKKQTTPDSDPLIAALADPALSGQGDYVMKLDTTQFRFFTWPVSDGGTLTIEMDQFTPLGQDPTQQSSYTVVTIGNFTFNGVKIGAIQMTGLGYSNLLFRTWQSNWFPVNMGVEDQTFTDSLSLKVEPTGGSFSVFPVLTNPISPYDLMFPQDLKSDYSLLSSSPVFFFQDSQRTFYVTEETAFSSIQGFHLRHTFLSTVSNEGFSGCFSNNCAHFQNANQGRSACCAAKTIQLKHERFVGNSRDKSGPQRRADR
jgi:hypothetical protein